MRSLIFLSLLCCCTAACAKSIEPEAIAAAVGGAPQIVAYGWHWVRNPYIREVAIVYRDNTFWLVGTKGQLRLKFSCDQVLLVQAQLKERRDEVQVQTSEGLVRLGIDAFPERRDGATKIIQQLQTCVRH
jgi:hypothetical protein